MNKEGRKRLTFAFRRFARYHRQMVVFGTRLVGTLIVPLLFAESRRAFAEDGRKNLNGRLTGALYALRVFEESAIGGKSNSEALHVAYRYYALSANPSTKVKLWRVDREYAYTWQLSVWIDARACQRLAMHSCHDRCKRKYAYQGKIAATATYSVVSALTRFHLFFVSLVRLWSERYEESRSAEERFGSEQRRNRSTYRECWNIVDEQERTKWRRHSVVCRRRNRYESRDPCIGLVRRRCKRYARCPFRRASSPTRRSPWWLRPIRASACFRPRIERLAASRWKHRGFRRWVP